MRFYIYNWYKFTVVWIIILLALLLCGVFSSFSTVQYLLLASFISLFAHQAEEYLFPAGGPVVINKGNFGETERYRTYPGNMLSSMIVNNLAYIFYACALILPQAVWLGLATTYFNLFQLVGHGFKMNRTLGTWYNPGLLTTVVLLVPVSIWYMIVVGSGGLASTVDWLWGLLAFIGAVLLTTIAPVQLLKGKGEKYPMEEWQVERQDKLQNMFRIK